MMRFELLLAILVFCSTPLLSVEYNTGIDKADVKKYSDNIMQLIRDQKLKDAFVLIKKVWPMAETEIDTLEIQTASQLEMVKGRYGSIVGYLLVDEKEIGETFIRYIYVVKYERHITRWEFIYYKPGTKWIMNSFKWDDNMGKLFE